MVDLLVCTTCRAASTESPAEGGGADAPRPGAVLAHSLPGHLPEGVRLVEVECLSNCTRGCTVALRGPRRWTYVYGNLDPAEHLGTIAEGAARYLETQDGRVPWRQRPEHFKRNCIARIPPMETIDD